MNLFTRLSDIISANLHTLVDRVEDPELLLAHLLRNLEAGLASARRQAAHALAAERGLRRELEQHRAASDHWKEQARKALALEREDLARQALAHKLDHEQLTETLEPEYAAVRRAAQETRSALHALQKRLAEARRRQSLLIARRRAAQARLEVERSLASAPALEGERRFDQIERRLLGQEDEMLALVELSGPGGTLEESLTSLEREKRIDQELASLKIAP